MTGSRQLRLARLLVGGSLLARLINATEPNEATRRWWSYTQALANDKLQGRDTGSPGYATAADIVIKVFKEAGLAPAGTHGYRQPVPLQSLKLNTGESKIEILRATGIAKLAWYRQVTVAIRADMPRQFAGPLYFAGDESASDPEEVRGAAVVVLGQPRVRPQIHGQPSRCRILLGRCCR